MKRTSWSPFLTRAISERGDLSICLIVTVCLAGSAAVCGAATNVRLRGGATQWDGRVEILRNKTWGTVCDTGWDLDDANVVCRQLGFALGVGATTMSAYGAAGEGVRVWVEGIECEGEEGDIGECERLGEWGMVSSECEDHSRDAGVICADDSAALNVRLLGGASEKEGLVEIYFGDRWGRVCDDGWGIEEATVVCNQLGLSYTESQPTGGEFGEGGSVIWLDDVVCEGRERGLADCSHAGWGQHNCLPSENVGVRCIESGNCSIRLSTTEPLNRRWAGTVEVFAHDEWGRVCSETWSLTEAEVVCRQLGFHGVLEATGQVSNPPSDLYWLAGVDCTGFEEGLCECVGSEEIVNSECISTSDAGVVCKSVPGDPYDLRLVGGVRGWEGRVEVSVNGEWGTVCSLGITEKDSDVICQQLSYQRALITYFGPTFGAGVGEQWFQIFNCSGEEESVFDCPRAGGIGEVASSCSHNFDTSVICQAVPDSLEEVAALRLVGGATLYEGQLQVFYNGRWGKVCMDGWEETAASIACSQLGYGVVLSSALSFEAETNTSDPVQFWLDDLACRGNETALSSCPHSMWGAHDCYTTDDAIGLACAEPSEDPHDLRLVGGETESSGRLEVWYGGVWGTVCSVGWDMDDAEVACRQLGFHGALTLLGDDTIPEGAGLVWLEGVGCRGNESRLTECDLMGWGLSQCDHTQDIGLMCDDSVAPLPQTTPPHTSTLSPSTSPRMLLPLPSSSPNEHSTSLPTTPQATPTSTVIIEPQVEDSILVTMATNTSLTKATPTNDLSTSGGNDGIQSPVVIIGGSTLGGIFLVAMAIITVTIIFSLTRLKRRGNNTEGEGNGIGTSRAAEGSSFISFNSLPQHTQVTEEENFEEGTEGGGVALRNFRDSDAGLNAHYPNPYTEDSDSPDHVTTEATPTHSPGSNSEMELGGSLLANMSSTTETFV